MRRRGLPTILLCAAATVAAPAPAPAATDPCAAWPGEPAPLPETRHADVLLAHWAQLRARELATSAERFERAGHTTSAHRLWRHAHCLDPKREAWRAALARTRPIQVRDPSIARVPQAPPPLAAESLELALARLDGPILVAPRPAAPEPVRLRRAPSPVAAAPQSLAATAPPAAEPEPAEAEPSPLERVDAELAEVQGLVQSARFEDALTTLARLRESLGELDAAGADTRRARLEVLAGTAALALQRDDEARESFVRALAADPQLRLDPATTSPKVVRAFEQARERGR